MKAYSTKDVDKKALAGAQKVLADMDLDGAGVVGVPREGFDGRARVAAGGVHAVLPVALAMVARYDLLSPPSASM